MRYRTATKTLSGIKSALTLLAALVVLQAGVSVPALAASVLEADDAYQQGEYRNAVKLYRAVEGPEPEQIRGAVGLSKSLAMVGQLEEAADAVREAISRHGSEPVLVTQLAEVLFTMGQSSRAMDVLSEVVDSRNVTLRALVKYGEMLQYRGRRDDAEAYFATATAEFNSRINATAEDVALAARAYQFLGDFQDANRLYREATQMDRNNAEAQTWWGDLFAEKFNSAEAMQSYRTVLQFNPNYPPALIGLALASRNKEPLEQALFTNPGSPKVFAAYAELSMKQNKFDEASSYLNAALPNNEEDLDIIIPLAGVAILRDDTEEYEHLEAIANEIRPGNGEFYTRIGEYFSNDYRFKESIEFARKAIAVQPDYWPAYTVLGMNLVRNGEEEEGREVLELAFDRDPFNFWTSNMLTVFDTLDTYVTRESEHFKVRLSERDAMILWPYMEPLLEEAWDTLSEKYGFTPEGPVLVEMFEKREDFAVRSVGLPDIGPLVGICFGKVITLISPDTLSANWQEIVWHEFMHVITLQMTQNRIPRWLSEGISVYEEFQGRQEWGRHQDLDIERALNENKIFPIERIDDAFTLAQSDDDLNLAYLQSYLVVDFVAEEHGIDGLKQLISAYGTHAGTREILQDVFDQSPRQFNQAFSHWLETRMLKVNVFVSEDDASDDGAAHGHGQRNNSSALLAEQYSNDSLKRYMTERIRENPRDFQAHLQLGIVLFKEKEYDEAEKILLEAKEILPKYTGFPSPPLVLSQIYEARGEEKKYLKELEFMIQYHQHDFNAPMVLARHYMDQGDYQKADYYLQRAISVDPYRLDVHQEFAKLAEHVNEPRLRIREYEILARLDNTDPVNSYTRLAEAYLDGGEKSQAKNSSLRALEIAPTYEPAQQVLLEAVGE